MQFISIVKPAQGSSYLLRLHYLAKIRSLITNLNYRFPIGAFIRPFNACFVRPPLTHWGRVTHIRIGKLTIIGSDNGLSPGRHQAII